MKKKVFNIPNPYGAIQTRTKKTSTKMKNVATNTGDADFEMIREKKCSFSFWTGRLCIFLVISWPSIDLIYVDSTFGGISDEGGPWLSYLTWKRLFILGHKTKIIIVKIVAVQMDIKIPLS